MNNNYWDNTGKYQRELNKLTSELMPVSGNAKTLHGELVRGINRLYYEYCNNGNCNVMCYGKIDTFYKNFLKLFNYVGVDTSDVENLIKDQYYFGGDYFTDDCMELYDSMVDSVMEYILRNEDKEIPSWYF